MNLLISGKLCKPPSSVHCFRDVTLYASVFNDMTVLLACNQYNKDRYWQWLKSKGAFDFIEDIVCYDQEPGLLIAPMRPCGIQVDRLTESGLNRVITQLDVYTSRCRV